MAVANWFGGTYVGEGEFPQFTGTAYERKATLRYGENPHQRAALYTAGEGGLANAEQLHGKEMSYNNYLDADAAWRAAWDFSDPCVAIIKHQNPCGIAVGADVAEAHRKAHACDPVSAYGGVIAVNRPVTEELARQIFDVFTEVVIAPDFDAEALDVLRGKKSLRLLRCPSGPADPTEFRRIDGGLLVQTTDRVDAPGDSAAQWELKTGAPASPEVLADLEFAWRACRSVKSNAILLASDRATVGVGMGQVNRVDSCRLAVTRAGERVAGSVAASDAFFPFPDGLEVLAEAGVRAIVEPGGSVRDAEVVEAAEKKPASPSTSPAPVTSSTDQPQQMARLRHPEAGHPRVMTWLAGLVGFQGLTGLVGLTGLIGTCWGLRGWLDSRACGADGARALGACGVAGARGGGSWEAAHGGSRGAQGAHDGLRRLAEGRGRCHRVRHQDQSDGSCRFLSLSVASSRQGTLA
ncbi:hypothetical protein GCM10020001_058630 [Nonomuraea salmonea]